MGLWFLWVLAWCLVALNGICWLSRGSAWKFAVLSAVFLLGTNVLIAMTRFNLFAVHLISYYFPYYFGGYAVARWRLLERVNMPVVFMICGSAFAVLLPYWTWKGDILFMQMIHFSGMTSQIYRMIVAWTAICFIAGLFSWRGSRGGANANSDWLLREGDIGNICVTFLLFVDRIKIVPIFLFAVSGCL